MATDLYEILKYAPIGLPLYSSYNSSEVILKEINNKKGYPIICEIKDRFGNISEATFNRSGEYFNGNGMQLFPSSNHLSWNNWQLYIFPNCINSVITDNGFEFYQIISNSSVSPYGMNGIDMETISMSAINLTMFKFASADDITAWHNQPIQNSYFKPFDKVLVRNKGGMWHCLLFSHQKNNYYFAGGKYWYECVPYNKYTEYLIGSTEQFDMSSIRKNKK